MEVRRIDVTTKLEHETEKRLALGESQCARRPCTLLFNTSSLRLTGAINDTGVVARTRLLPGAAGGDGYEYGTEVAVFAFDSIELGPEVNVTLCGQRALVLLSRSSVLLNTTLRAKPGTLGGFVGGYSVARYDTDLYDDFPRDVTIHDYGDKAPLHDEGTPESNNINGPGSPNVRVYLLTVRAEADDLPEIQTITTSAQAGQTLGGSFVLRYAGYATYPIPCDATAADVKAAIEDGLNAAPLSELAVIDRTRATPGVGRVNVTRATPDSQGGYVWTVTFRTATPGDIATLGVDDLLTGIEV